MNTWFTADHHWGNENITGYVGRKDAGWDREFADAYEMDTYMVAHWLEVVRPEDTVYYLGDFTLRNALTAASYLDRLTGKIKFIPGGHDWPWLKGMGLKKYETGHLPPPFQKHEVLPGQYYMKVKIDELEVQAGGRKSSLIVLNHYPMFSWERSHKGSWHLHGHSHGGRGKGNRFQTVRVDIPSVLEMHHSMDVGVDAGWDFYPVHLDTIVDKLGDEEG